MSIHEKKSGNPEGGAPDSRGVVPLSVVAGRTAGWVKEDGQQW